MPTHSTRAELVVVDVTRQPGPTQITASGNTEYHTITPRCASHTRQLPVSSLHNLQQHVDDSSALQPPQVLASQRLLCLHDCPISVFMRTSALLRPLSCDFRCCGSDNPPCLS